LEPLAVNAARLVAYAYEISGDIDNAPKQYRLAGSLPGDHILVNGAMMTLGMAIGDHDLVKELSVKVQADLENESMPPAVRDLGSTMHPLLESPEQGLAELRRMRQDPTFDFPATHSMISAYASGFGDHELALEVFQATLEFQLFSPFLIWRPIHKEMRRLPGVKNLVQELGLLDYWRGTGNWGDFGRPIGDDDFECR
jgi:hypothetical protein